MTTLPKMTSPLAGVPREYAVEDHVVWTEIFPEFHISEFRRPFEMDVGFLRWLSRVRRRAGVPMYLTSDARTAEDALGASGSAHHERPCRAIDGQTRISMDVAASDQLARIYIAAVMEGCRRFGTYRSVHGAGDIYHLDLEDSLPAPRWWTKW